MIHLTTAGHTPSLGGEAHENCNERPPTTLSSLPTVDIDLDVDFQTEVSQIAGQCILGDGKRPLVTTQCGCFAPLLRLKVCEVEFVWSTSNHEESLEATSWLELD